MKFHEWVLLNEEKVQKMPILFAGDLSAIIPSEHDGPAKIPSKKIKDQLAKLAEKALWFEGVGERHKWGKYEKEWISKHLGVKAGRAKSYDRDNGSGKTIYSRCYDGMGPAILMFSDIRINKDSLDMILKKTDGDTVEAVIKKALASDIVGEGAVPRKQIDKFINICKESKLDINAPKEDFIKIAKQAEKQMWKGDWANLETPLGILADKIEHEREDIIVEMMFNKKTQGLYFIGSGHIPHIRKHHPELHIKN